MKTFYLSLFIAVSFRANSQNHTTPIIPKTNKEIKVYFPGDSSLQSANNFIYKGSAGEWAVFLLKDSIGPAGGIVQRKKITPATKYELEFDMKFDEDFDFGKGGKVGFGFLIGEGYTGGGPANNGNGGSARIMWSTNTEGRVYLKPYLYYKDQPGKWGEDFKLSYPAIGSIKTDKWYTVKMSVESNTGSNEDGNIKISINGSMLIDRNIRWTTNDAEKMINTITFETFRGGNEAEWKSPKDGNIKFANMRWNTVKEEK